MPAWGARSPLVLKRQPGLPAVVGISAQPTTGGVKQSARPAASYPTAGDLGWQPPPIPAGAYNPIRDIELNNGKTTLGNTLEDLLTKQTRASSDTSLSEEGIGTREKEEGENHDEALKAIADSFKKLSVRQGEQARTAGVTRGGALLQAAAKRAANETKTREPVDQTFTREQATDQTARGQLALKAQREAEDVGRESARAEREQGQFGIDTKTLEAREASDNGYVSPVSHVTVSKAGWVRVGGPPRKR